MSNIEIKNLTFSYEGETLFEKVNLSVDEHWKLGLVGLNGHGKTSLLKIISGELELADSDISSYQFSYFPMEIKNKEEITLYLLQELADFESWKLEKEFQLLALDQYVL